MERLNQWTTLVANIGVIAGIVVLAYQISENTQQMKDASLRQHDEMVGSWRLNMYSSPELAELWHLGSAGTKDFDEIERLRYRHLVIDFIQRHRTSFVAAKTSGHIAQMEMTARTVAVELLGSEGVQLVWEPIGREISHAVEPEFVLAVDRWLDELGASTR